LGACTEVSASPRNWFLIFPFSGRHYFLPCGISQSERRWSQCGVSPCSLALQEVMTTQVWEPHLWTSDADLIWSHVQASLCW
jgi:hypothetical protein